MLKLLKPITLLLLLTFTIISCNKSNPIIQTREISLTKETEQVKDSIYPNHPITLIVAYKKDGGTDKSAQALASVLKKYLPVDINIENVPGADGELGYTQLCNSHGDGYTLGFINLPTFITLPQDRKTQYCIEDIQPLANMVYDPSVLVVLKDSKYATLDKFLEQAKEQPYRITVGNNGYGASNHIATALLCEKANIKLTHVPFGGSADMLMALKNKRVDAVVAKISEVANIKEAKILCSFTKERIENFEMVPTLIENDIPLIFGSARAIVAPKDMSKALVDYLTQVLNKAIKDPQLVSLCQDLNLPLLYMDKDELTTYIKEQNEYMKQMLPNLPL